MFRELIFFHRNMSEERSWRTHGERMEIRDMFYMSSIFYNMHDSNRCSAFEKWKQRRWQMMILREEVSVVTAVSRQVQWSFVANEDEWCQQGWDCVHGAARAI